MDNESETETDPVYYEAESFYATPAGNTAASSDHSKSFNENDVSVYEMSQAMQANHTNKTAEAKPRPPNATTVGDMSKATSEPIQIYLNCLLTDTVHAINDDATDVRPAKSIELNNELPQDDVGGGGDSKSCTIAKSYSENILSTTECTRTNAKTITDDNSDGNGQCNGQLRLLSQANAAAHELNVPKVMHCDDETASNCDAGELLTPVNEMNNVPERYQMESADRPELSDNNDHELISATARTHKPMGTGIGHCKSAPPPATTTAAQKYSNRRFSCAKTFTDGKYKGKATHCDGNVFNIFYTISSQELPCGRKVYCVWICRDECDVDDDDEDDGKHPNLTLTFNSITSNAELSIDGGMAMGATAATTATAGLATSGTSATASACTTKRNSMNVQTNQSSRPNSVSLLSQYDDDQVSGEYTKHYTSLKQIGKGAFGYVKLSFRHSDRLLVVTKFILKDKLPPQFMVVTDDKKEIPMEVYLLSTLKHPNIVTVLDVFENDKFFQLVMEKHGSGMDLFEFIDRRPLMDEQLGECRAKGARFLAILYLLDACRQPNDDNDFNRISVCLLSLLAAVI